ncbi:enoyl-CoA hydratase/isomerase family protein [Rhodococcoides kyotonense]|uniref:Enoyl-CoA hydratase n=1 Tax=Rhodococcoides kyotonense TaxID=398843 RepID=A0A239NEH9_9NOCA|nr:enoyl-CoA hydratase-related protein [Rhodococcus kyotonensis]SNT53316.1 enoyl-CoA hydratase [Rhodococcus kyotonensis]
MTSTVPDVEQLVSFRYDTPHVAVITIDNYPANALSGPARLQLGHILDEIEENLDVRAVVIASEGEHWSAGGQLREDEVLEDSDVTDYIESFMATVNRVENFRVPVIAAIQGGALGGGMEFALACDIRIASTKAFFVAAGVNVGLIVSFWRLPRLIGLGPAKEILLTGERCKADHALRVGLVSEVVEPDELLDAALKKARRIASRAPLSVEATKAAANKAHDLDFAEGHRLQIEKFGEMFRTNDHKEALAAFFGKREGNYVRG